MGKLLGDYDDDSFLNKRNRIFDILKSKSFETEESINQIHNKDSVVPDTFPEFITCIYIYTLLFQEKIKVKSGLVLKQWPSGESNFCFRTLDKDKKERQVLFHEYGNNWYL